MTFRPDSSQLLALKSWYHESNPLYKEARHPVIKLAGEAGEIVDLFGKNEYKPNFSWWKCKACDRDRKSHNPQLLCNYPHTSIETSYTPLVLDELGDYSYYLRILCWQKEVSFEAICQQYNPVWYYDTEDLAELLSELLGDSSLVLEHFLGDKEIVLPYLVNCVYGLIATLSKLDTTLEQVLDLNYKKLNTETMNGWVNAR